MSITQNQENSNRNKKIPFDSAKAERIYNLKMSGKNLTNKEIGEMFNPIITSERVRQILNAYSKKRFGKKFSKDYSK